MRVAAAAAFVLIGITAAWWVAGDHLRALWAELTTPLAPHAQYARSLEAAGLHETALARDWLSSSTQVLATPDEGTLPFTATGAFDPARPTAAAWRFEARLGQRVEIEVALDTADVEVFLDLFRVDPNVPDEPDRIASAKGGTRTIAYEPDADGALIVRVQPELLRGGAYTVRSRALATMQFPVQGATPRAVRSVFGDERDRGARAHEGVDIFAPRGTPVIAATDGWVTGSTTNRLGGNVVWVWDPGGGQALYYAHLDRQDVSPGERVRAGEVIGFVGNTGNARGTAPHLHFGIYRADEGAVDPLPFICDAPCAKGMAYAR